MTRKTSASDGISEKLNKALDGLRKDVTRVEIWATALATFAKPVPDYQPNPKYELKQRGEAGDTGNFADSGTGQANKKRTARRAKDRRKKGSE